MSGSVIRRGGLVAAFAMFACWGSSSSQPATMPVGNQPSMALTQKAPLEGEWWCAISQDDYRYENFPCTIENVDGKLVLAKHGGSQRFKGVIAMKGNDAFSFSGKFYCPHGACDQPIQAEFTTQADGEMLGVIRDDQSMRFHLVRAQPGAFGGAGYAGLGGRRYGGDGYGGFQYGGRRYGHRRMRP